MNTLMPNTFGTIVIDSNGTEFEGQIGFRSPRELPNTYIFTTTEELKEILDVLGAQTARRAALRQVAKEE